jgi:hypothetical protein
MNEKGRYILLPATLTVFTRRAEGCDALRFTNKSTLSSTSTSVSAPPKNYKKVVPLYVPPFQIPNSHMHSFIPCCYLFLRIGRRQSLALFSLEFSRFVLYIQPKSHLLTLRKSLFVYSMRLEEMTNNACH